MKGKVGEKVSGLAAQQKEGWEWTVSFTHQQMSLYVAEETDHLCGFMQNLLL